MFIVSEEDMEAVKTQLRKSGLDEAAIEKKLLEEHSYFLRRVQRRIPNPEMLVERLESVVAAFRDVQDSATGKTLFSGETSKAWDNLKKHAENGCLSDPEGLPLYYSVQGETGAKSDLRCARGSSRLEG